MAGSKILAGGACSTSPEAGLRWLSAWARDAHLVAAAITARPTGGACRTTHPVTGRSKIGRRAWP